MSDNVLKKEFSQRDVNRLRNLLTNKSGEKTTTSIGYSKQQESHSEGDIWEEDNRTWTIKDGIKQNITKLDQAKQGIHLPLFCPECNKYMKHKFDKPFYMQYKRCWDCQINFETQVRANGQWENYEKQIHNDAIDGFIKDFKIWSDEEVNSSLDSYITEAGDVEKWIDKSKNKIKVDTEESIKYLNSLKK